MDATIGKWAFIVGVIVAILAGFITVPYVALILVILGLVVGFLNISDKESSNFLIATIALTVGANAALNVIPAIGLYLETILINIVAFVVPAALVVSLKAVYGLAKTP